MINPKISIITVCFNSASHIEEAILSVINQSYDNLEYIIIDGGSSDNTMEIVEKYRSNISIIVSEPDRGISDAFNKGISLSTGELIGILNSDDYMMPNVLNRVAEQYQSDIDIYRGYCLVWDEVLNTKKELHPNNRFGVPPWGAVICHESAFITRKLYDKVGGYKLDFKYCMDLDLFIRIYKDKNVKTKFLNICVDTFRTGGASSSPAYKLEDERKRLILENGGSSFDVIMYLSYHRLKYFVKKIVNIVKLWRIKR